MEASLRTDYDDASAVRLALINFLKRCDVRVCERIRLNASELMDMGFGMSLKETDDENVIDICPIEEVTVYGHCRGSPASVSTGGDPQDCPAARDGSSETTMMMCDERSAGDGGKACCTSTFDAPRLFVGANSMRLHVCCFYLSSEEPTDEMCDDDDEDSPGVEMTREWLLPSRGLHSLWDSLVFGDDVKRYLLEYASSAILFSRSGIDASIITWNRVVLLHGPPGTGKTSLCRALAHKLAIRYGHVFKSGAQLVEVNAHSLFSKWFSESGKLVARLFSHIQEMVEDESMLTFVLLDEVESLTAARSAAVSGSEPSDAVRVVNALLTQIDALRSRPNVMILTTTNITAAVDTAFIDRADIKAYIGLPPPRARYDILRSCVDELIRGGIVTGIDPGTLPPYGPHVADAAPGRERDAGNALAAVAMACDGTSGRFLRKLPFLAHASCCTSTAFTQHVEVLDFMRALLRTAEREAASRRLLSSSSLRQDGSVR